MTPELYFVSSLIVGLVFETGQINKTGTVAHISTADDRVAKDVIFRNRDPYGFQVGRNRELTFKFDRYEETALSSFVKPPLVSVGRVAAVDQAGSYKITVDGTASSVPVEVSRKIKIVGSGLIAPGEYKSVLQHTVYLKLQNQLQMGQTVKVEYGPSFSKVAAAKFASETESVAIHIPRVGFEAGLTPKFGYFSAWLGVPGITNGPGPRSARLDLETPPTFSIVESTSNKPVLGGQMARAESSLKTDLDLTSVYRADFSALKDPGSYRLVVDGVGSSAPFRISTGHWATLFKHAMRGFYHQRSGVELEAKYTDWTRPRSLHPDDGFLAYQSGASLMDSDQGLNLQKTSSFKALAAAASSMPAPEAWGGWHDAGDWDRRIQHLDAVRALLTLSSLQPEFVEAASLRIPAGAPDIPDTIIEALWGLDVFRRLQTKDGAIRGGIEGSRYSQHGEASWTDPQTLYVYAPDPWSSYLYSATAAMASAVLKKYNAELSAMYGESAIRAYAWAEAYLAKTQGLAEPLQSARNLGAANLYLATADPVYAKIFRATSGFVAGQPARGRSYHEAGFIYLRAPSVAGDQDVREMITHSIIWFAEMYLREGRGSYDQVLDPWRPYGWGNVSNIPEAAAEVLLPAYHLTGAKSYLDALAASTFFGLGANPDNMVYTTGLDRNSPREILHKDAFALGSVPPPGITIFGTRDVRASDGQWWHKLVNQQLGLMRLDQMPIHETFQTFYMAPELAEFTVKNGLREPALVWGYLAGVVHAATK